MPNTIPRPQLHERVKHGLPFLKLAAPLQSTLFHRTLAITCMQNRHNHSRGIRSVSDIAFFFLSFVMYLDVLSHKKLTLGNNLAVARALSPHRTLQRPLSQTWLFRPKPKSLYPFRMA